MKKILLFIIAIFFINYSISGSNLTDNNARSHYNGFYKKAKTEYPLISLVAVNGQYTDEIILVFIENSETGIDPYDTQKMFASDENYPQLWYEVDEVLLAVNAIPEMEENMMFPLGFRAMIAGEYSIETFRYENIESNVEVVLEDRLLNVFITILESSSYSFYSDVVDNIDRFRVHISLKLAPTTQTSNISFSSVAATTLTIDWSRGNGDNVLILAKQDAAISDFPVDGTEYTANAAFGSGDQIGTANYVVYNWSGDSVEITALSLTGKYFFRAY